MPKTPRILAMELPVGAKSPEAKLLIQCVRAQVSSSDRGIVRSLLRAGVDWPVFLKMGERHAVLPLLHQSLSGDLSGEVPPAVLQELRQRYQINAVSNTLHACELGRLVELFRHEAVDVLAFKGPVLSTSLYGNVLCRQFGDLDLLVRRADVQRATSLLESAGYQLTLSRSEQRHFLKHRYHLHFAANESPEHVEVHWAFTPCYWQLQLDEDYLWQHRTSIAIDGVKVPCLSTEHRLLVLCAHGAKERWARLQLVADVAQLLRVAPDIDWAWLFREVERTKRQRILLLGLRLAHRMLGAELPDGVNKKANCDATANTLAADLVTHFFDKTGWPLKGLRLHRYFWHIWPRLRDRSGYIFYVLRWQIPDKVKGVFVRCDNERDLIRLPRFLSFLYFMIRPVRLLIRYRNPVHLLKRLAQYL